MSPIEKPEDLDKSKRAETICFDSEGRRLALLHFHVPLSLFPVPKYWNPDITKFATPEFDSALVITLPLRRYFYICLSTCIRPLIPLRLSLMLHAHSSDSLSIVVSVFPPPPPRTVSILASSTVRNGLFFSTPSPPSLSSRLCRPASIF